MKRKVYFIFQMVITLLVSSCTCNSCGKPGNDNFYDNSITITFVDKKTLKNLYPYFDPTGKTGYNKDSIQVKDQTGNQILVVKQPL